MSEFNRLWKKAKKKFVAKFHRPEGSRREIVVRHEVIPSGRLLKIPKNDTAPESVDATKLKKIAVKRVFRKVPASVPVLIARNNGEPTYSTDPCSECKRSTTLLYKYRESSKGSVQLCDRCNTDALERSFGKDDAFNHRVPGDFEKGRPKR